MIDRILAVVMAVTPTPEPDFNPDSVTPGWIGFTAMFIVVLATLVLMFDMVRRVRRTRYRGEIREQLETERQAADLPTREDEPVNPPAED